MLCQLLNPFNWKSPVRRYISVFLFFLQTLFASYPGQTLPIETNFPELGEHIDTGLSTQTERLIGNMIMQKIYGSDFIIADPVVNEYLQGLAIKFTPHIHTNDFKLHFFGVNTPELNAFAFFGAHVAVHSGLILAVTNESELAAVLAHETAHITQRHLARIVAASRQMMPLTFAEVLAAIAVGALGAPDAGVHLATAALAGHVQQMINFTREHEQEADRIGIQLLAASKFDPAAMASVFQRMKKQVYYHEIPPEYLLTHPVFDSRIADAQNRAESFPYQQAPDSLQFHLVRARLEVAKEENTTKKINRFKDQLVSGRYANKAAMQYGHALALVKNQQAKTAIPILKELTTLYPNNWMIEFGMAEAEASVGLLPQALNRIKHLLKDHPVNYAIVLQYAAFLIQNSQANEAVRLLLAHRKAHAEDPALHQLLAKAYSQLNQATQLHRSQAEWHFARGEFKEALQQLELTLEHCQEDKKLVAEIQKRKETMQDIIKRQREIKL